MTAAVTETGPVKILTSQATATPLGLMAFAVNIFLLSMPFSGIVPVTLARVFVAGGIFFGLAQMVAGFFEYRMGSGFLGLTFCSFGVFWISTAFFFLFQDWGLTVYGTPDKTTGAGADGSKALGTWLLAWTLLVACLWAGSYFAGRIAFAIFTLLMIVLLFFIIGSFGSAGNALNMFKVGALVGLVDSLLTFYFAAAMYLNEMTGKTLLKIV
jgi:uncharacterized protein